jgi:DNA-binding NarL/FixJ family response regulator
MRRRVAAVLTSAGYLVEQAGSEQELLAKLFERKPQIVVLDFAQSSLGGLNMMQTVRKCRPEIRIIVLSPQAEEQLVRRVLDIGVCSYVLKFEFESKIALAVEAASKGLCLFDRPIADLVVKRNLEDPVLKLGMPTIFSRLTARELEIVRLLTLGSGNRQVATDLGIRIRTVETHRANVMRKLKVHTLTELIHLAVREGIIHIPANHTGLARGSANPS